MKFVHGTALRHPGALARFDQERHVLELIAHPNLVRIYGSGALDSGERWISMEYVGDRTLRKYLNELDERRIREGRPFPLRDVLQIFIDLGNALHNVHELGVVHRDIKPGNIVVDEDGRAVLVDFGLAKAAEFLSPDAITLTGQIMGSPAYASPEQVSGRPGAVRRTTDVYSLGVTLYECLTGTTPYALDGLDLADALRVIQEAVPTPPENHATFIERDLSLVILKALAKEPERRYPTARAFADDLTAYLEGRPVTAAGDTLG